MIAEILKTDGTGSALITALFSVIGLVAAYTDYRRGKIYNWLTFPAMALGLMAAAFLGPTPFLSGICALVLAFLIFIPLNITGVIGAGDTKLVMAFATILGVNGMLDLVFWSFIIGGAGSFVILLSRHRLSAFLKEIIVFLKSVLTPGLSVQWPKLDATSTAPFGLAITAAFFLKEALR